jgi:cobalamin 5'-phosphate synthase/cobalamin synthase
VTRLLAALSFLTRVPVHLTFDAREVGRSALFFPLVGAAIGAVQWGLFYALSARLPALLTAVLVVAFSAWLTRAMHLDGLADLTDGLAGGSSRGQALEIMRDPRVGAFGAVALVLVLATKIAAIAALEAKAALVLAPALARWTSVPLSRLLPNAREGGGLGSALTDHVGALELVGATLVSAALAAALAPALGAVSWVAVIAVTAVVGAIARKRLGGVTGDVLGANVELSEACALVVAVAW